MLGVAALIAVLAWLLMPVTVQAAAPADGGRTPNFVIIYIDDMGYGDIGPFGAEGYQTPNLDRMAKEGRLFTDFYVTQAVCSASRAGLMTGCYNVRVGILGALNHRANYGINADEMTLGELVKQKGYATACYGKWHLGHHPKFLPTNNGFDEYLGLPYSNDMWPFHPTAGKNYPPLPLIENTRVIDPDVTHKDQEQLTTRYTERAVAFIEKNKDRPFLVYLPHSMVHVPLHVSDKFRGKSKRGLFGDVVMEVDWSVGQILDTLRKNKLDKNTMVIFTADNGPWLSYGDHAGTAGPLREGKGTMFDGGCREPTIMWWPGTIPAGTVCKTPAMTIDVLPTIAYLTGAALPKHTIDGKNIWPLIAGEPGAKSPHEAYFFYWGKELQAVRMGNWKLHFPHAYRTLNGRPGGTGGMPVPYEQAKIGLSLFDLANDVGETTNVADQHPDVVATLEKLADGMRAELGDSATKQQGSGVREPGRLEVGDLRFDWTPGEPLDVVPKKVEVALPEVAPRAAARPSSKAGKKKAGKKAGGATFSPVLKKYLDARAGEFQQIPAERKEQLRKLASYVSGRVAAGLPARLLFICTHNSRRSHLAQLTAAAAAAYDGVPNVVTFSGGTQATAFNPRAVAALERAGFKVTKLSEGDNPKYKVQIADGVKPQICFSKVYDQEPNPTSDFCVVMTCSHADKACPVVKGATLRVAIPYDDPKAFDGTEQEAAKYSERCAQIAREMLYLFSQVRR